MVAPLPSSRIRYSEDGATREGHLVAFGEFTFLDVANGTVTRVLEHNIASMSVNVAAFLAWKHFRERSGAVVPSLPGQLEGCDFDWTWESRDTQTSPKQAIQDLLTVTTDPLWLQGGNGTNTSGSYNNTLDSYNNTLDDDWQFPFAMLGSTISRISYPLSVIGEVYQIPQISATSTSSRLDLAQYFARTVVSNKEDASAIIKFCKSKGLSHLTAIYVRDEYGTDFAANLHRHANREGIHLSMFSYVEGASEDSGDHISASLQQLKQSGIKYVVSLVLDWPTVFEAAYDIGIIGTPEHVWISFDLVWEPRQLRRHDPRDVKLAKALDGVGVIHVPFPEKDSLQAAMLEFAQDANLQREYFETFPDDDLYWENASFVQATDFPYIYPSYDSVLALGIAACRTPGLFTSAELFNTLVNLEFQGISGNVSFNNQTGTRSSRDTQYTLENVYLSQDNSNETLIRLESRISAILIEEQVVHLEDYLYNNHTTIRPPYLVPVDHNYNLIPSSVQVLGWSFGGAMMMLSLLLAGCVLWNKNDHVWRISQPLFLVQICIGTFITSAAIIPMGMQGKEYSRQLDIACNSIVWLLALGFVACFSAILSRTWRLNKLMSSSQGFRRTQVYAQDVAWPFAVLTTVNVVLLIGWTAVSPLQYERVQTIDVDSFGRSLESYGRCQSTNKTVQLAFMIPLLVANAAGVIMAVYQSYKARNFATELQESTYLAVSMLTFLETLLLGIPTYFASASHPSAKFLAGAILICISCMTIILPVFLPSFFTESSTVRVGGQQIWLEIGNRRGPDSMLRRHGGRCSSGNTAARWKVALLQYHRRYPPFEPPPKRKLVT
ncbi:Gamma-aminobutyric acid (GABA) B receptor [Seminavis robusta]|uniref:Gamma-aminobutyric acid (GABA) B receptor n=1 Tax=Seminavis robusta TaxID=568900 RepID=A0A9N8DPS5_9STRA|nr:Gamma-aminobutyric acid (GABA) B receptor [Seminavis robusta]|eukprot:Sro199_g084360.1 Gamma-aminobutyric acid (GABA) B receptor (835) ;mRNA; f:37676-40180